MHNTTYEQALSATKMLNEPVQHETLSASIVAALVAMTFDKRHWSTFDFITPSYLPHPSTSTFSPFEETLVFPEVSDVQEFEQKIASIYADFVERQEPLEREFAAVWDANVEQLYES